MRDYSGLVCYFPTTVMLVDENRHFMLAIKENLSKDIISCIYDDSEAALQEILQRETDNGKFNARFSPHILCQELSVETNTTMLPLVSIHIPAIYEIIYDSKRFERVSVIVVDYDMPGIDGLEVCRRLQGSAAKKVLLVSDEELSTILDAHDSGIVDQFVLKGTPDFCMKLDVIIHELQIAYFRDLAKNILNDVLVRVQDNFADKVLVDFFNNICHVKHVSEFYLLDILGSFLLLDFSASPMWFIVRTERAMSDFCKVAIENHAASHVIQEIEARNKLPFFLTEVERRKPIIDWGNYLHSATRLEGGKTTYYYSVPNVRSLGNLNYDNILSHRAYLAQIDIHL
jgi:CheY-like chemotaxis protein